ncbi:nucleotide sugar dehydrogenase [Gammaproteobacteria bacterium]|nr:nucleotide sugar dehydrogenase [Gammaproteobacteria bacterium]MDC0906768.1 nucleotide sugar dehydrogenase [Gammaproteobacteria bacterium]
MIDLKELNIAVIGLGYVGLPLAVEFSKKFPVLGFDLSSKRIKELNNRIDKTNELSPKELEHALSHDGNLELSSSESDLYSSNFLIVTVPTPIDEFKVPDLSPIISACEMIGDHLKKDDIVIFESTVFPGATEEICMPILESRSGLKFNKDFFCGYSPERINPGDKEHTISSIVKVTSGSSPAAAEFINKVYSEIINAGTFLATSIKVAEAAKVIENIQRDVNIALANELAIIFEKMDISTKDVLQAAGTKWNFLKFKPGLVGGHCIGVDPYYMTYKANSLGLNPQLILAGRRINDGMPEFVASQIIKSIISSNINVKGSKILVLGITFKENCPDIRNTKVLNLVNELEDYGCEIDVADPQADHQEVLSNYRIKLLPNNIEYNFSKYDFIIYAVDHIEFNMLKFSESDKNKIYDITSTLSNPKYSL